ncbi:NAD-dependent DNA ligase LigA [Helicobacter muridarum]|uniref:DNA ligase n=1 Tax=Helicobacter muridarum TaxID=216 RepID=A0A099TX76_9HELI|nr:NAD-dependent DNA ligase LigA [Helicobacter muridarum]TLE00362.1 NAD-dependent DNA ligase LigA [Helicobacter muridarum]STQ85871.1 NAD-dependent DNA ligase LigA [Helicobacter muridarum]
MTHQEYLKSINTLNLYAKHYYELDDPIASDLEYDKLYEAVRKYEEEHSSDIAPDSPTQRVGHNVLASFEKRQHITRMWSLEDVFNQNDLRDWLQKLHNSIIRNQSLDSKKSNSLFANSNEFDSKASAKSKKQIKTYNTNNLEFCISPKYDGMSLSLLYDNGRLEHAITRGNGLIGELVTHNAKVIESIPQNISYLGQIEIRGEVVMSKRNFDNLNQTRQKEQKTLFANARNAAAGSMRQLDSTLTKQRKLDFIPWGIGYYDVDEMQKFILGDIQDSKVNNISKIESSQIEFGFYDILQSLQAMGFRNHYYLKRVQVKDIESSYQELLSKREEFEFLLDGFVIVLDDLYLQEALGFTQKAPRFACAYKFPAHETTIQIESISWQVGRTGIITPVANFEPVRLDGASISRATLHNFKEIERNDIRIGDYCLLIRSGDVIPKITKVMKERRNGSEIYIQKPARCPDCNHNLHFEDIFIYCQNPNCIAKFKASLTHFASKKAFNIDGLGESIIDLLVDSKLVSQIRDIYSLQKDSLLQLHSFKEKKAQNLLNAIYDSIGNRELWRFIHALGILHIGEVASKKIATFGLACFDMSKEEIINIDGFGVELAESFSSFCRDNMTFLQELLEITKPIPHLQDAPSTYKSQKSLNNNLQSLAYLSGKTCVITGTFTIGRDILKSRLEELGARVSSSISSKTDFLLAGESAGSKLKKAMDLNIKILKKDDILELLQ